MASSTTKITNRPNLGAADRAHVIFLIHLHCEFFFANLHRQRMQMDHDYTKIANSRNRGAAELIPGMPNGTRSATHSWHLDLISAAREQKKNQQPSDLCGQRWLVKHKKTSLTSEMG